MSNHRVGIIICESRPSSFKSELGLSVDDIEKALVGTVIELSAVRRLREKQLRLVKILQANDGDISEVMQGLEASQLATELLRKRRKELATQLVKSRSKKEARSPGGVGEGMAPRRA